MNDRQTQMMINQAQQMMNQALPHPPQVLNQQPPPPQLQSQPLMMLNRTYTTNTSSSNKVNNSNNNNNNKPWPGKIGNFGSSKPRTGNPNNNWKGKKITNDKRRMDNQIGKSGYNPPTLHELQSQNRQKMRKFYPNKKKFNNNNGNNRFAPYAPRNTTSFIIRAKKAGGIASLVSPCPVTPAVLPTPIFSPSREVLGDMAKEEWGVDGYGSMKGLIRLRSGNDHEDDDDDEGNGSSESDVEEHVEVERRLDHDLSRFEMIYPNYGGGVVGGGEYNNVLENRVDDQDSHIAQLEEENLTLKERLFLMERELGDLRRRLQFLERQSGGQHQSCVGVEDFHEEVVENGSENESENGSDVREHKEENNEDVCLQESVPVKKEEDIVRSELGDDSMSVERDECRHIEGVDKQMVAEVKSKDEPKEAVNEIDLNKVNLVAEKEESKDEEMCVEKSIDGMD